MEPNWTKEDFNKDYPFQNPAFRAYLNALPNLLKEGNEGGCFVCDRSGTRTASGKTHEEAARALNEVFPGCEIALSSTVCSSDLETHRDYYLRNESEKPTPGRGPLNPSV